MINQLLIIINLKIDLFVSLMKYMIFIFLKKTPFSNLESVLTKTRNFQFGVDKRNAD